MEIGGGTSRNSELVGVEDSGGTWTGEGVGVEGGWGISTSS